MIAVNYSTVRNNFKDYCEKASKDFETIIVTRERGENYQGTWRKRRADIRVRV